MSQIIQFLSWHGGLVLFLSVLAEQSGVPVPAAPFLLAAGALVATGHLNFILAITWITAACVLADAFWFYAGRRGKARFLALFGRWRRTRGVRPRTTGARATLRGLRILTAAKFLPLGTLVPLRAGTLDVNPLWFLLLDIPSALFYASVYLLLGYFFHHQLSQLIAIISGLGMAGLLLVLLTAAIYATCTLVRRHQIERNPGNKPEAKILDSHSRVQTQAPMKH
jgi:membrane protein DedA with SNARE-associated domain